MKYILLARTKNPAFGSGKIIRRIKNPFNKKTSVKRITRREVKEITGQHLINRKKKAFQHKTLDGELDFINTNVKTVFKYWNKLGYPFKKHREMNSKVANKAVRLLDINIRKYKKRKILEAIDTCHWLFQQPWFRWRKSRNVININIPNFIQYDKFVYENLPKGLKQLGVKSWMKECFKSLDYLQNKYSLQFKNKYPIIVNGLMKSWMLYKQLDKRDITIQDKNNFIICANYIVDLVKAQRDPDSGLEPMVFVSIIDTYLNYSSHRPKIPGAFVFGTDTFLNGTLLQQAVHQGYWESISDIRRIRYNKKA